LVIIPSYSAKLIPNPKIKNFAEEANPVLMFMKFIVCLSVISLGLVFLTLSLTEVHKFVEKNVYEICLLLLCSILEAFSISGGMIPSIIIGFNYSFWPGLLACCFATSVGAIICFRYSAMRSRDNFDQKLWRKISTWIYNEIWEESGSSFLYLMFLR
jgi:uncharacterized membrane protein YdjX (TVP38/TMEM64 family)